jgi:hypothetical protein
MKAKQKDFRKFTKIDRRMLCERLEHYYLYCLVKQENIRTDYSHLTKSALGLYDRRIRSHLKSCEILLISLKSPLFDNVTDTSIRKTLTIEGRISGIPEIIRKFEDSDSHF